jgi:hypothetical protein
VASVSPVSVTFAAVVKIFSNALDMMNESKQVIVTCMDVIALLILSYSKSWSLWLVVPFRSIGG